VKPKTWVRVWLGCTIVWLLLAIPSILWWSQSIAWLVFMSVWANIAASAAAWQAAKADAS
jgi:hypothetical protein